MAAKGCTSAVLLNRSLPRAQALAEEFPEVAPPPPPPPSSAGCACMVRNFDRGMYMQEFNIELSSILT